MTQKSEKWHTDTIQKLVKIDLNHLIYNLL
jgi:hypothetical protein